MRVTRRHLSATGPIKSAKSSSYITLHARQLARRFIWIISRYKFIYPLTKESKRIKFSLPESRLHICPTYITLLCVCGIRSVQLGGERNLGELVFFIYVYI